MNDILFIFLMAGLLIGCKNKSQSLPEPHMELGQRINFVGAETEKIYVVIGYRHLLEDKTEKEWKDHDYIVFSYANDQGEIKVAATHRNAILNKR